MAELFRFPNPVNEVAARLVAAGVVAMSAAYLLSGSVVVLGVIAYGFVARVATGPTLSPLGRLVTQVVVPRLGLDPRPVPGPPKRFAQGIGATVSTLALAAHLAGAPTAAFALIAAIVVAASLEAFVGFCLGCWVFARMMALGLVPTDICAECGDISERVSERLGQVA